MLVLLRGLAKADRSKGLKVKCASPRLGSCEFRYVIIRMLNMQWLDFAQTDEKSGRHTKVGMLWTRACYEGGPHGRFHCNKVLIEYLTQIFLNRPYGT